MKLNEYQERAMGTRLPSADNVEYMMLNLIGEVGELAEKLIPYAEDYGLRSSLIDMVTNGTTAGKTAKAIRKGEYDVFRPIQVIDDNDLTAISKEMGDVLWQLSGLADVLGFDMQTIAQQNLDKLQARKSAGTIDGNGDGNTAEEGRV